MASPYLMMNIFMAGADIVRWELTAVGAGGPYRLTICHPHGSIVEYFQTTTAALAREAELEYLLVAARGVEQPALGAMRYEHADDGADYR